MALFLILFTSLVFVKAPVLARTAAPSNVIETEAAPQPVQATPPARADNFFETVVSKQMDFLLKKNANSFWPSLDVTFENFLKNERLDYSNQGSVRNRVMDYCKEVTKSYEKKVIKQYGLPPKGSYFLQSCELVQAQLHAINLSLNPGNINQISQFVLLQHHTVLNTLTKAPYFSLLQNSAALQADYDNSLFGRIGISQSLNYILTQSAVIVLLGILLLKIYKLLAG